MSLIVGRGWATVELDRAAAELRDRLRAGTTFRAAPGCVHLGARCVVGEVGEPADPAGTDRWLVLMEPSTEGRLAVTLARHGEGWAATWTVEPDGPAPPGRSQSAVRPGPLGP